jgi:glycosyltransferase involved in cell wall biosynthesis
MLVDSFESGRKPLRILFATEYLPPFVSGISNRCKNWINGYRQEGHQVTVCSVHGSECDIVIPSIANPFYKHQRFYIFNKRAAILPPLGLALELANLWEPVNYDVCHIVAPLCLAFLPLIPLMWLRGIKIYISYHVLLEYYRNHYIGDGTSLFSRAMKIFSDFLFPLLYYIPLAFFADCVGIPSKTADFYVFEYSQRVHLLKSGLDTSVFHPDAASSHLRVENKNLEEPLIRGIKSVVGKSDHSIKDIRVLAGTDSNFGPILIYTGRLALEKSIDFLIEALNNPLLLNSTLVIVGDGPIRPALEDLAVKTVGRNQVYSAKLEVQVLTDC